MSRRRIALIAVALAACSQTTDSARSCAPLHRRPASQWTTVLDRAPAAAAVDARGVVVTTAGAVHALDHDGRETASVPLEGAGLDWPAIDGDLVVVPVSAAGAAVCVGLDREPAGVRWRVPLGAGRAAAVVIGGSTIVCASKAGRLVAVETDGAVRWSVELEAELRSGPVSVSPRGALAVVPTTSEVAVVVYTGGRWRLACRDLESGADRGACDLDLGATSPPSAVASVGDGAVVVGVGQARSIVLYDLAQRRVRAAIPTAHSFDPASIPLVAGDRAVLVDRFGGVTAVDAQTGTPVWRADLGEVVLDAKPAVAGGAVHVVDWTGRVHHLRLADGRRAAGTDDVGGAIAVVSDSPATAGSTVLVTLRRGSGAERVEGQKFEPDGPDRGVRASENSGDRPLQCPPEPGQSTRNDARP